MNLFHPLGDDEERTVVHLGDEVPQRYADGAREAHGLACTPDGGEVGIGARQPVDIATSRRLGHVDGRETGGQVDQPFNTFEHAVPPFVRYQLRLCILTYDPRGDGRYRFELRARDPPAGRVAGRCPGECRLERLVGSRHPSRRQVRAGIEAEISAARCVVVLPLKADYVRSDSD